MKQDSLAILFSTATTLTFSPMKTTSTRSTRSTTSTTVFHKCVGQYHKWLLSCTLCFTKQTKRGIAPPHFARSVTDWLNNHFPNQWVGRNESVETAQYLGRSQFVWFLSVRLYEAISLWKSIVSRNYRRASTTNGSGSGYSSWNPRSFFTYPCKHVAAYWSLYC